MTEHWRDIPGYEGEYKVSDLGRVRSLTRWLPSDRVTSGWRRWKGGILSPGYAGRTRCYAYVHLCHEGIKQNWYIHDLVLLAFVGPKPEGLEVCHGSGGQKDNRLANLCYGTASKNCGEDCRRDGTGRNVPIRRLDGVEFESFTEAAHASGLRSSSTISMVLSGCRRTAGGFTWERIHA